MDGNVLDIQADIIGPSKLSNYIASENNNFLQNIVGTPYEGGVFKCKLVVDSDFPAKPPKGTLLMPIYLHIILGFFLTRIFHPNVA